MLMDIPYRNLIFIQLRIVLRATQTLDALTFFKKKVLSDFRSEIHLFERNIVSIG